MMELSRALSDYRRRCERAEGPDDEVQVLLADRFLRHLETGPSAFERTTVAGHFTASALVSNNAMDRVLLTLHAKLGLWLQLGGHADGNSDLASVALKECEEESGLTKLLLFPLEPLIFDLDLHSIPARKQDPEHLHFDVRFLVIADQSESLVITPESKDLRWVALRDAYGLSREWSMHRQFDKLGWLKNQRGL